MRISTFACDNCGTVKKDDNKWWLLRKIKEGDLRIIPFGKRKRQYKNEFTLCGTKCLIEKISKEVS